MSVNVVAISGNLTRDVEMQQTRGGTSIAKLGIAVNDRVKNHQTDQWEDRPNFFECIIFGKRAESLSNILKKGMKVAVQGKLRYSSWETDNGDKRSKVEIIVDDVDIMQRSDGSKGQQQPAQGQYGQQPNNYAQQQQYAPQNAPQQPTGGYQQQYQPEMDVYQSDIPF